MKKVIVVFGATGAQGGGLVRSILNDAYTEFSVRAVTRDLNSDKAKELTKLGVECVQGDVSNPDDLDRVLHGAYGAYYVTFFWHHFSPEKEFEEVRLMAEASKKANLQHVIYSTLEDTRRFIPLEDERMPTLQEKYKVPHFDAKGEANKFFTDLKVPTTFLHTSFYWENLIYFGMGPKKGDDGKYYLNFPMGDKELSGIAAEDIGKCAYGIFKAGTSMVGKSIGIAGEHITLKDMASTLGNELNIDVSYNNVPFEVYRNLGFPGADDLGNMFQFYHDFADDFIKLRDTNFAKSLNPELMNFKSWVKSNSKNIPIE